MHMYLAHTMLDDVSIIKEFLSLEYVVVVLVIITVVMHPATVGVVLLLQTLRLGLIIHLQHDENKR